MGRPREFDEQDVLATAGEIFWAKGYEGTSTRDLTAGTGLTHSSLYGAFGDKRGLYLKALDQYLDRTLRERIARIERSHTGAAAIGAFFDEMAARSLADPLHRGCMMVNTAIDAAPGEAEFQRVVADETQLIEAFFRRAVEAGQASGEIARRQSATDLSRHLLSVLLGLRVLARVRPDADLLNGLARSARAILTT
ncbi:TetR/AcrR family transcriptional regulator [Aliidongia dinghuensis]|nr:TetR/AcrR family transcriptional regulator [Aliidongia dinghuensis]